MYAGWFLFLIFFFFTYLYFMRKMCRKKNLEGIKFKRKIFQKTNKQTKNPKKTDSIKFKVQLSCV